MKLIIAGGRDFSPSPKDTSIIRTVCEKLKVTEIISGAARGADRFGETCARWFGIPLKRFPADWDTYGRAAGGKRNSQMADYADAVLLFPGNSGTADMRKKAKERDLLVIESKEILKELSSKKSVRPLRKSPISP